MIFDVFGTLVDWRSCIAREVAAVAPQLDGEVFADAWRAGYQPAMEDVRTGRRPWVNLDVLHREILDRIVVDFGVTQIDAVIRARLVAAWHRLDGWPDVTAGLARIRERALIAPCSNGHIALVVALARHNHWQWDAVLGAELVRTYKTRPEVYLGAAAAVGCEPHQVMMVACHSWDLAAAAGVGMQTAHVARPDEKGPGLGESEPSVPVDLAVDSITQLAELLG